MLTASVATVFTVRPLCAFTSPFLLCSPDPVSLVKGSQAVGLWEEDSSQGIFPSAFTKPVRSPARGDQSPSPHCKSQCLKDVYEGYESSQDFLPHPTPG